MELKILMALLSILALCVGLIVMIFGLIMVSRGKKDLSDKLIKTFGAIMFLSSMFGVFYFISDMGAEKANNEVSDTLKDIADTVKTGGLLDKDARPDEGSMFVHYIDVGDGEATLLDYKQDGERKTILIDMGRHKGTEVEKYLKDLRVRSIDVLIGTNADVNHLGEIKGLVDNFRINEVWMSKGESTSAIFGMVKSEIEQKEITYYEPSVGEEYIDGKLKVEVLGPNSESDTTLGIKVTFGEVGFIFTSDSPASTELGMLNSGVDVKASVLQLGNHGEVTSTSGRFLEEVSPQVAVYSSTKDIDDEVLNRLESSDVRVYGTNKEGTVRISTDGKVINVSKTGKQEIKDDKVDIKIIDKDVLKGEKGSEKLVPVQIEKNESK